MSETMVGEAVAVAKKKREVRLSAGTIARISTELKSLGFAFPDTPTCWSGTRSVGDDDDRLVQTLVERIVSIAPLQLMEMLEGAR